MKGLTFRIALDIVLFIAVFILPWWLWLICVAFSVFVINHQYEIILLAFLADAAYGGGQASKIGGLVTGGYLENFKFFFLASVTALLIVAILLRPRLNFHDKSF